MKAEAISGHSRVFYTCSESRMGNAFRGLVKVSADVDQRHVYKVILLTSGPSHRASSYMYLLFDQVC